MNQITLCPFANFNSAVPWGLWVSIYIWLVGISAGSFLLVAWGSLKNNPHLKSITRLGMLLSLAALLAGLLSILIDLGHIERFYELFISPNPSSVMAWMVWLYSAYSLFLLVSVYLLKKGLSKSFLRFAFLSSLAVIIIESMLFAIPPGRHWHSPVFVAHFLTSSLVSAIAALIVASAIFIVKEKKTVLLEGLSRTALPIIALNLCIEFIDIILLGGVSRIESWIVPFGNIIAILLLLKRNPVTITLAGGIALINILLSKYNALTSAQVIEPFRGFSRAYIENRLQFNYTPTTFEFLVSLFLVCLAASIFYFLYKIFPLTREE